MTQNKGSLTGEYLAGVADSCGHFHINLRKGSPFLSYVVTNSKLNVVEVLAEEYYTSVVVARREFQDKEAVCKVFKIQGQRAVDMASAILQHVHTDRAYEEAKIALQFPVGTRGKPRTNAERDTADNLMKQLKVIKVMK